MKKSMKTLLGLVMAMAMVLSLSVSAFAADGLTTVKKSYQTYEYTQNAHPLAGKGPISISKGKLKENGKTCDIYLVAIHGLEATAIGRTDDLLNCLLAGTEQESQYLNYLIRYMEDNIPKGSNVVFAGHSLGGMVAQQAAAKKSVQDRYNILYTVTFGSPLLAAGKAEGKVNRMAANGDAVPYLSVYTFTDLQKQLKERNAEDTGFSLNTHVNGYRNKKAWKNYDAVGNKGGKTVLKIDDSSTEYYDAPLFERDSYNINGYASFYLDGNYTGVSVLL